MADFYLDNDVTLDLVPLLSASGQRVTTTRDLFQFRAPDDAQLLTAARNRWTLVTFNRHDFVMLHDAWVSWPAAFGLFLPPHSGILVVDPASPERLAAAIIDLVTTNPIETQGNLLYWWHRRDGWRRRTVEHSWE